MKQSNQGSAILTVIMTITLIMIVAGTIMRSATLFHDFALQRVAHERQVRSLQALLNYAIAWCMVLNTAPEKDPSYHKIFNAWPPGNGQDSAEITINYKPGLYAVTVYLKRGNIVHATSSCHVRKKEKWLIE